MSALIPLVYHMVRYPQRLFTVPANAYRMPLETAADYARAMQAESPCEPVCFDHMDRPEDARRVLLDNLQYFVFFAELSIRIRREIHADVHLFIEVCAPYFGPLPDALLHADVLLGVSLSKEARWHAARGEPVVWVGDRIRRDLDFSGDNSVHCGVWPKSLTEPFDELMRSDWSHFGIGLRHAPFHPTNPIPHCGAAGEHRI